MDAAIVLGVRVGSQNATACLKACEQWKTDGFFGVFGAELITFTYGKERDLDAVGLHEIEQPGSIGKLFSKEGSSIIKRQLLVKWIAMEVHRDIDRWLRSEGRGGMIPALVASQQRPNEHCQEDYLSVQHWGQTTVSTFIFPPPSLPAIRLRYFLFFGSTEFLRRFRPGKSTRSTAL